MENKLKAMPSLKAILIIQAIVSSGKKPRLMDICNYSGLSKSTVHRILDQLVEAEIIKKNTNIYEPGNALFNLLGKLKNHFPLIRAAASEMDTLNLVTKETVNLIMLTGFEGIYIDRRQAINNLSLKSEIGWKMPLYCTAGGRCILSCKNQLWLEQYFKNLTMTKYTENTTVKVEDIKKQIEFIKKEGYFIDEYEHNDDILCIAAPIKMINTGEEAAISISAPGYRFSIKKALSYKDILLSAVDKVSKHLMEGENGVI